METWEEKPKNWIGIEYQGWWEDQTGLIEILIVDIIGSKFLIIEYIFIILYNKLLPLKDKRNLPLADFINSHLLAITWYW